MSTKWLIAAAAAVGAAILTVPMMMDGGGGLGGGPVSSHGGEGCQADKPANLDFTVKDMNGADFRLADQKGKVILLNFWATWCGPCKVEIPAFVELYEEYKDRGLTILGVSGDDDPETLRAFASEWKMNYPVLVGKDHEDLLDAYGPIWGYPTSFFIGRDGSICGKHMGPATKEDFEKTIKALL